MYKKRKKKYLLKNKKNSSNNFNSYMIIFIIILIILIISTLLIFRKKTFINNKYSNDYLYNNITEKYIKLNKTEIIDDYLFSIPSKYEMKKNAERESLNYYINLKDLAEDKNDTDNISKTKKKLLKDFIDLLIKPNVTEIKDIFFTSTLKYGNRMVILNNLMFYCELLGIKNIYLDSNLTWFIKNKISTGKINIFMASSKDIDCDSNHIECFKPGKTASFFFLFQHHFKPQIRLYLIRNEVKKNLPKLEINQNDLVIHIRSGDIFEPKYQGSYSQPPLCFYQKVINKFKFNKIYLIAQNKNNPVINKILEEFPNIIYQEQNIATDISYLVNAYNLVASVSTFLTTSVMLNDNLVKFFEYDIYRHAEKFIHLNHEYFYFPMKFTIYTMKPSITYKNEMFELRNEQNQYNLMLEEKCNNDFTVIEPNI